MDEIKEQHVNIEETKTTDQGETAEGFTLSGEYVKNLSDKHFTILNAWIDTYPNKTDKNKTDKVNKCLIELANGIKAEYRPNMTSARKIMNSKGPYLKDWAGFQGEFMTASQFVSGTLREVIYIQ